MIENSWFKIWQLAVCLLILAMWPQLIGAQESFVVRPTKIETTIKSGESQIITIEIINNLGRTAEFTVSAEDAGPGDSLSPLNLLGSSTGPYSLKNYLTWPQNSFRLDDGEKYSLLLQISIPEDKPPGSLHGAVIISSEPVGEGLASVVSRIGSLLFVKIDGQTKESGRASGLALTDRLLAWSPARANFQFTFINDGNVYLNPYGLIKVKDIWGRVKEEITLPPAFVLPGSSRFFPVAGLEKYRLGRYKATLYLNRGYEKYSMVDNLSLTFWSLPIFDLMAVILLLTVAIGMLYLVKSRKR